MDSALEAGTVQVEAAAEDPAAGVIGYANFDPGTVLGVSMDPETEGGKHATEDPAVVGGNGNLNREWSRLK